MSLQQCLFQLYRDLNFKKYNCGLILTWIFLNDSGDDDGEDNDDGDDNVFLPLDLAPF